MSVYHPDTWVLVQLQSEEYGKVNKVLAGWYGGFTSGDSWKLSSGIESARVEGDYLVMPQSSGSEYRCHLGAERFSGMTQSIYQSLLQKSAEDNGFTVKLLTSHELLEELKNVE